MHHHFWGRAAVAVTLVMALVGLSSSPASAATASISSGTIGVGVETFTVGGGIPDKCTVPLPTQSLSFTFAGTPSSGTWTASGSFKLRFRLAPPNDAQYWQFDIALLTASGTYSGTAPNYTLTSTGPNHITMEFKLYRLTPPGCAKTDLACTMRARAVLTAGSSFTGTLPVPAPGDTMKWIGTSNTPGGIPMTIVGPACPATITSQFLGKHVTFSPPNGLSFTF